MTITLLSGDCRAVLPTLAANSVHCVVTSPPYYALRSYLDATHPDKHRELGSESTPDEYLATMVAVFRQVNRVLRPDGTVWCNIGDSYNAYNGNRGASKSISANTNDAIPSLPQGHGLTTPTLANKQLLLMPARLALALQADGWWVRSDIIWHKPNPMPESVTDRPTSAYEHIFLLTKSARYFWDSEAVREPQTEGTIERFGNGNAPRKPAVKQGGTDRQCDTWRDPVGVLPNGRNLRNVWTIATQAFSKSHFATMPTAVVERCIRAGTSERGVCSACGAQWRRTVDKAFIPQPDVSLARGVRLETQHDAANQWPGTPRGTTSATTTGWSASCACAADVVPATVLDPFAGAGTTLLVADRLQRNAVGIELNVAYTEMAMERVRADAPLFVATPPPKAVPLATAGSPQLDLFGGP